MRYALLTVLVAVTSCSESPSDNSAQSTEASGAGDGLTAEQIVLDDPTAFASPTGEAVMAEPGIYRVESRAQSALALVSDDRELLVAATTAPHQEEISEAQALLLRTEGDSGLHLIRLEPQGAGWEAIGYPHGVRPRDESSAPLIGTRGLRDSLSRIGRVAPVVREPAGGARLTAGSRLRIAWSGIGTAREPVRIDLFRGTRRLAVVSNSTANDGAHVFVLQQIPGTGYRVIVSTLPNRLRLRAIRAASGTFEIVRPLAPEPEPEPEPEPTDSGTTPMTSWTCKEVISPVSSGFGVSISTAGQGLLAIVDAPNHGVVLSQRPSTSTAWSNLNRWQAAAVDVNAVVAAKQGNLIVFRKGSATVLTYPPLASSLILTDSSTITLVAPPSNYPPLISVNLPSGTAVAAAGSRTEFLVGTSPPGVRRFYAGTSGSTSITLGSTSAPTWLSAAIAPPASAAGTQFGESLAVSGNTVVVGAGVPSGSTTGGRVYVYTGGSYASAVGSFAVPSGKTSVDAANGRFIVSTPSLSGARVYKYATSGWSQEAALQTAALSEVHRTVRIAGDWAMVSDHKQAFLFRRTDAGWISEGAANLMVGSSLATNVEFDGVNLAATYSSGGGVRVFRK